MRLTQIAKLLVSKHLDTSAKGLELYVVCFALLQVSALATGKPIRTASTPTLLRKDSLVLRTKIKVVTTTSISDKRSLFLKRARSAKATARSRVDPGLVPTDTRAS